jgi:hypothetical protein
MWPKCCLAMPSKHEACAQAPVPSKNFLKKSRKAKNVLAMDFFFKFKSRTIIMKCRRLSGKDKKAVKEHRLKWQITSIGNA